jgi:spoIIIJ-associated protein
MENTVQNLTVDLLAKVGIQATAEVAPTEDGYTVKVNSDENALLIGKHGNTLSSLESILSLMVNKTGGDDFKRIIVEVGGYRQEREEYLRSLVDRLREEVISTGAEKRISGLKPWERRLVHMYLAENTDVETESIGEDRERVLIIRKK